LDNNHTVLEKILKIVMDNQMSAGEAMKIFTACLFSTYNCVGYSKDEARNQAIMSVDALYQETDNLDASSTCNSTLPEN
jgi:hypothetical protein